MFQEADNERKRAEQRDLSRFEKAKALVASYRMATPQVPAFRLTIPTIDGPMQIDSNIEQVEGEQWRIVLTRAVSGLMLAIEELDRASIRDVPT